MLESPVAWQSPMPLKSQRQVYSVQPQDWESPEAWERQKMYSTGYFIVSLDTSPQAEKKTYSKIRAGFHAGASLIGRWTAEDWG